MIKASAKAEIIQKKELPVETRHEVTMDPKIKVRVVNRTVGSFSGITLAP